MLTLPTLGAQVAPFRPPAGLTQSQLAARARIGHSTLDALENGHLAELGFAKIVNLLAVLGKELQIRNAYMQRPTMEDLLAEDERDRRNM
jgi:transcriptional regulator with XRE-family HTH domain